MSPHVQFAPIDTTIGIVTISAVLIRDIQEGFEDVGISAKIIFDDEILTKAIEKSWELSLIHPGSDEKDKNTKIYGSLAFWILKLRPIFVLPNESVRAIALNKLVPFINISDRKFIHITGLHRISTRAHDEEDRRLKETVHYFSNELFSISLYTVLCWMNENNKSWSNPQAAAITKDIGRKVMPILISKDMSELIESFRFHNYSGRAFSTLLHQIRQDALL